MAWETVVVALSASVATAIAADRLICLYKRHVRKDRMRLDTARRALAQHSEAVQSLLNKETLDPVLRKFLLDLSMGVTVREVAQQLVSTIEGETQEPDKGPGEQSSFVKCMYELAETDKETFEQMTKAMRSALAAMVLQWPETAKVVDEILVEWAADGSDTVATQAAVAIEKAKRHYDIHGGGHAWA